MLMGAPKEIKPAEYREGLTPTGVRELDAVGHDVVIQILAGEGIGLPDAASPDTGKIRNIASARSIAARQLRSEHTDAGRLGIIAWELKLC